MAKLLPNRISETMNEVQHKQFMDGIKMAFDALPKKPVMSKEEYDKIPKKGTAREKEADLKIKVVRRYPQFLPTLLPLIEVEKDNTLYDQINELYDNHLQPLVDLSDFLLGVSGGEEMNAYSRFADIVRSAAKDSDPAAIEALNELEAIDKQLTPSSPKKVVVDATSKALVN